MWRKAILQALVGISLLLLGLKVSLAADNKVVHFLTWANYVPDDVVLDFEKKTGINVKLSYFDGSSMLRAKMFSGDDTFDLIMPDLVDVEELVRADLLRTIPHNKLQHWEERDVPMYNKIAEIDADNQYALIYSYGTTGVALNTDIVKKTFGHLDSDQLDWSFLLDPENLKKLSGCGVSFFDEPIQIFGITLHYLGLDPNSNRPEDYEKAAVHLMKLRPYLTYFSNDLYIQDLAGGNICAAMAYSGDLMRAKSLSQEAGVNLPLRYILPAGGSSIWFDVFSVPKKAPHPEAALAFLNYLISPHVAQEVSTKLYQPTGFTIKPGEFADKEIAEAIIIDQQELKGLFIIQTKDAKIRALMQKLWLQIKYRI
jgi:putrescine transport system substrate-binding protein